MDASDLVKGVSKSSCATEVGVGTDVSKVERASGLWQGLSKCNSSDLSKSEAVAVPEEGTEPERPSLGKGLWRGLSKCNSSGLSKSEAVAVSEEGTEPERPSSGKGLWRGLSKCTSSVLGRESGGAEEEEPLKKKQKHLFPSDIKLYFPSTWVNFEIEGSEERFRCHPIHLTYEGTKKPLTIVKGKRLELDVVSLLSNGGKRNYLVRNNGLRESVDSIAGKHLLICCFKVPLQNDHTSAHTCRAMIAAYSRLRNSNEKLEMVMVAKTASATMAAVGGVDEEAAFNRFFEALPCLAIPFSDTESRDFLCKSLGLTIPHRHCAALVLDPDQVVLQTDSKCFYKYGAFGFPYTDERLDALAREDEEIKCRFDFMYNCGRLAAPQPVSLVELLGSDILVSRFGGGDEMSVSDLSKKKCVALYLCGRGSLIETEQLERIRENCVAKNLEFEVLVVLIPYLWDTASFFNAVKLSLERYKLSSWWVIPSIDEEAIRRLWRMADQLGDQCFFLADGGKVGELEGRMFINEYGSGPQYYPFTRKTMADDIFQGLRRITLESVLLEHTCINNVGESVPVSDLKGRRVLLYLDWCHEACERGSLYRQLRQHYKQIKTDYPDSEVVFVPLDRMFTRYDCDPFLDRILSPYNIRHPWLVLPLASAIGGSVANRLFPDIIGGLQSSIVVFGKDGHILSRRAQDRLSEGSVFADTLLEEILSDLRRLATVQTLAAP